MAQESYFWDGTTVGDATLAPYGSAELMDIVFRSLLNGTGNRGVLRHWWNELEVTAVGLNTVQVDTGASIVYGLQHYNNAALNVNIPNGPRTDLITVRRNWAGSSARIYRLAGSVVPVQIAGNTWDIPLAEVTVDGAGNITLVTDVREYCIFSTELLSGIVDTAAIADNAVTVLSRANHTRSVFLQVGDLHQDATTPANWNSNWGGPPPRLNHWSFGDLALSTVWGTLLMPYSMWPLVTAVNIYAWTSPNVTTAAGGWRLGYVAQVNGTGAPQSNVLTLDVTGRHWGTQYRDLLGTMAGIAGRDHIHLEFYRDGVHAGDTSTAHTRLYCLEFEYEDSV